MKQALLPEGYPPTETGNGLFGYSDDDLSILKSVAERLVGMPDIHLLISKLGYASEGELCKARGHRSLLHLLLEDGGRGLLGNIEALANELHPNTVGYF